MASQPSSLTNMLRAAVGALPVIPRGDTLPSRTVTVDELPIDAANVAAYADVTGLRFTDTVPLTYPFVLTFPAVMELATGFDFPFPAMGSVHTENHITRLRPITVSDTVGITVSAANLREHRKGLLVDLVSEVSVGNETAWRQVTTFLHQQRTSLSDEPKPEPAKAPKLPPPNSILKITPGQIRRYASIGGDHNPIHTSGIGAAAAGKVVHPRDLKPAHVGEHGLLDLVDPMLREGRLHRLLEQKRPTTDENDVLQALRRLDPLPHRRHRLLRHALGQRQVAPHVVGLLKHDRCLAGAQRQVNGVVVPVRRADVLGNLRSQQPQHVRHATVDRMRLLLH